MLVHAGAEPAEPSSSAARRIALPARDVFKNLLMQEAFIPMS
jgi:hypothetical protein